MRLFIAIQLNKSMKDALTTLQNQMQRQGVRGNFTRCENLHLTLAFIGEYPDPYDIKEIMETIDFESFTLSLDGMGSFGSLRWTTSPSCAPNAPKAAWYIRNCRHLL